MVKKYVEVTISLDDTKPDVLEVFHRSKEDEGAWSDPSDTLECSPNSTHNTSIVELKIKKL